MASCQIVTRAFEAMCWKKCQGTELELKREHNYKSTHVGRWAVKTVTYANSEWGPTGAKVVWWVWSVLAAVHISAFMFLHLIFQPANNRQQHQQSSQNTELLLSKSTPASRSDFSAAVWSLCSPVPLHNTSEQIHSAVFVMHLRRGCSPWLVLSVQHLLKHHR